MNLSITNECNRRCEYCFQKAWYLANNHNEIKEMSIETIEKYFEWMGEEQHLNIMGGEPLLHSKFLDILELAKKYDKKITIFSNITCDEEKLKYILDTYTEKPIVGWLINTDYPEPHKEQFLKNFDLFHYNNQFSLATTLLPDSKKTEESAKRINELLDMLEYRTGANIRISPMAPNHLTNYKLYDYTLDVVNFISKIWDKGICKISFDCTINCCEIHPMVSNTFNQYKNFINFEDDYCAGCGAFDILVDNSILYCSSSKFIKLNNFMDYNNLKDAKRAMFEEYKKYWQSTSLQCNYKDCEHFNTKKCLGVCAAKNEILRNKI